MTIFWKPLPKQETDVRAIAYYVVKAKATQTRHEPVFNRHIGDEFIIYIGFDRGMTDSGQTCWTRHGPTQFASFKEAHEHYERAKLWPMPYDGKMIPDTVEIHCVTQTITTETSSFVADIIPDEEL